MHPLYLIQFTVVSLKCVGTDFPDSGDVGGFKDGLVNQIYIVTYISYFDDHLISWMHGHNNKIHENCCLTNID